MAHRHWPFFDLRITTPRLELRILDDDLLTELAELAMGPIHDPAEMPFEVAWTDAPPAERARSTMQYRWLKRATLSPSAWDLSFATLLDGRVIGSQDLGAERFLVNREVTTGSWLAAEFQGQGFGKEMRRAVLVLAFDHLGAQWATSAAALHNMSSRRVSESLGYQPDGLKILSPRDEAMTAQRFRMSAGQWQATGSSGAGSSGAGFEVHGLDACLPLLGLGR